MRVGVVVGSPGVAVRVRVLVAVSVRVWVGVAVHEAVFVGGAGAVIDGVGVAVRVHVPVGMLVPVRVWVGVAVRVAVFAGVAVAGAGPSALSAAAASTIPRPHVAGVQLLPLGKARAVSCRMVRLWLRPSVGLRAAIKDRMPDTCGAAMLVPW